MLWSRQAESSSANEEMGAEKDRGEKSDKKYVGHTAVALKISE